jgi:hypothetical protein
MAKWRWWGGRGACVRATLAGAVNVVRSEDPDVPRPPLPGARVRVSPQELQLLAHHW